MSGATLTPFRKILIANRGEIALRVMRTAKRLGYETVAVYSTADASARHVREADQAVWIGESQPSQSYLRIDAIIAAAKASGADAVHPGYGFLAENADFAKACREAGLVFIGPSPEAIHAMGNKAGAKDIMQQAGVPCVPGYQGEDQGDATMLTAAKRIGFPVMIKAVAGGGGRGMRLVPNDVAFPDSLRAARSEAQNAFGDPNVILERAIVQPRHIEIQVFGDRHGNAIHLGERDCSVQRRHQKLVEEAPSPAVSPELRARMGATAVAAVKAIGYEGAGTLEFLLDSAGNYYFMEMNTRLQVEHPVTELITGVDLVEWQLRVAFGEKLPLTQDQIKLNGHAIEARVYAENPNKNFMPSVGRIRTWRTPGEVDGLRIDAGYGEGKTVSPNYDAMLAKVIAWAPTRDLAISRLNRGLQETDVRGIVTNIPFLSALITHPDVRANTIDTSFIERELAKLTPAEAALTDLELAAAVGSILLSEYVAAGADVNSPWRAAGGWAAVGARHRRFMFRQADGTERRASLRYGRDPATLAIDRRILAFASSASPRGGIDVVLDGVKHHVAGLLDEHEVYVRTRNGRFEFHWVDPFGTEDEEQAGADRVVAPLPGTVVAILVEEGAEVEKGAAILTLEVMKMEQTLRAPFAGTVKQLKCKVGDIVQEGVELAEIEPKA